MKTNILLFVSILCLCLANEILAQNTPSYVPVNGLKGWYPFTGNAMDSCGDTNHGTVTGASLAADRFNRSNQAYSFNGSGNRITFNNKFPFHDTGNRTLSFWVKLGTITNGAKQGTILKSSLNSTLDYNRFNLYIRTTLGMVLDYRSNNSNMGSNLHTLNIKNGTSKDTWQHVVYTRTNTLYKVYINGTYYNSSTDQVPSLPTGSGWILGDDPCGNLDFAGSLDDLGIWNRALNDSEIVKLYQSVDMRTNINTLTLLQTKIYPNPTTGNIHLEYNSSIINKGYRVCISNVLSHIVYQSEITNQTEHIDLKSLGNSGMYFLILYNAENRIVGVERIFVETMGLGELE